jgi:glycosyltransferase involved in cell wall biosynthesis
MPDLSVIIPCFNAEATLAQQLGALSAQACDRSWEVVLSNNGSTDNSVAVAESYRNRLPELQIVDSSSVRGVHHARNVGVAAARGRHLLFCDADDEVAPGWLAAMADALDRHPFVTGAVNVDHLNPPWLASAVRMEGFGEKKFGHPPHLPWAVGANFGIRRDVAQTVGPWNETFLYADDMEFSWRVQQAGFPLSVARNAVVYYRLRSNLVDLYRHARNWGDGEIEVRKRFDPNMKRFQVLRRIAWLLRHVPAAPWLAPSKARWAEWIWELGYRAGQVRAAMRTYKHLL